MKAYNSILIAIIVMCIVIVPGTANPTGYIERPHDGINITDTGDNYTTGYIIPPHDEIDLINETPDIIPQHVPGDVTGDGVVDIRDVVLLSNYVSFPNERGTTYILQ